MHPLGSPHFVEQRQAARRREADHFRLVRRAQRRDDAEPDSARVPELASVTTVASCAIDCRDYGHPPAA